MATSVHQDDLKAAADRFRNLTGKYLTLTNGITINASTSMLEVITAELPQAFGYARAAYNPGASAYDSGQDREELSLVNCAFAANGAALQYDHAVLVSGASATASVLVTAINDASDRLEFDADPELANGDKVVLTADMGGTVPAALLDGSSDPQILYVVNSGDDGSTWWIQLALTSGGSAITFTGGALPVRVRFANGVVRMSQGYGSTTIQDGLNETIQVAVNFGDGLADVNVL